MSEISELKEQLSLMQQRINELEREQMEQPVQRRNMLKAVAGVAAGAAVGGLGFARPAAAADGSSLVAGDILVSNSPTSLLASTSYTQGASEGAILSIADVSIETAAKLFNAANGGSDEQYNAVKDDARLSVLAVGASKDNADIGITVAGVDGIRAYGTSQGIQAFGRTYGGAFEGGSAGIAAQPSDPATGIGAKLGGDVPLKLVGSTTAVPSEAGAGHFRFTGNTLYFGVGLGTGKWRRVASEASAGVFVAVDPFRAYDSRAVTNGRLGKGENVVVDCSDALKNDGTVDVADALPAGATAIVYNLTAVNTGGRGYLQVAPGDATSTAASAINWSSAGLTIANGSTVKLDGSRQVKVFCGGPAGAAADFIIDIVGYYH